MNVRSPLLARHLDCAASAEGTIFDADGRHGYRQLGAKAGHIAGTLLAGRPSLGGERVAMLVPAGADFVAAFFGVLRAGGCVVVLSTLHPLAETEYFCDDASVRTLVVSRSLVDRIASCARGRRVLVVDELSDPSETVSAADVQRDAPALQLYTSGTTGRPKGAVLTHENLAVQQALLRDAWGLMPGDVLLHALPLHHMHGLCIALLSTLGAGASVRMLPQFEASRVWEALGGCSVLMAVPTMYQKLFAAYDAAAPEMRTRWAEHARRLRLSTSGSAALPVTLAERWRELAGDIPVERFGMTEIGVGMTNPLRGERRAGTVGLPLPTVEIQIVDDAGKPADTGELWVAGPSVFQGYFQREQATAQAFVEFDGKRFFRTGDTVTRDADGYVRILGRTSVDILKSGGYKLSALEIEEALRELSAIAEVAIVGVPDETWGDRVVACVVARPGAHDACAEEAVRAFARTRMARYKVPKRVLLFAELPRNALGKVLKPELAKLAAARLV